MSKNHITIRIISTIPDMVAEHYYFIKHVFPDLKEICLDHDIVLDYVDLFYSMTETEFNSCRSVIKYFESIDSDRTFYVCFRGQKLGCVPTHEDIDRLTLQKYPELVSYIGNMSFMELTVMHAIHPFEKCENGEIQRLPPVKHSLFYFRDEHYLDMLSESQQEIYTCKPECDDEFVQDLKLAMAKDLIFQNKQELDGVKDSISHINVRKYEGIWYENGDLMDISTISISTCYDDEDSREFVNTPYFTAKAAVDNEYIQKMNDEYSSSLSEKFMSSLSSTEQTIIKMAFGFDGK